MALRRLAACSLLLVVGMGAAAQPCLPDPDGDGHPLFGNPHIRAVQGPGGNATDFCFADFDGDGHEDALFAVNQGMKNYPSPYDYVYIVRGRGDGTFDPNGDVYPAGPEPCAVAAADFNGDGRPDIAVANANGDQVGTVSVLLNLGDGTFGPQTQYPVGAQPRCVRAGDLDGDGHADLAVLNVKGGDVSILFGNGNGTFRPEVRIPAAPFTPRGLQKLNFPYPGPFMALGDVDGDGDLDLALPCVKTIRFLINDGRGGFTLSAPTPQFPDGGVYDIAIADLNGDGVMDLGAALMKAKTPAEVGVALGAGGLAFNPPAKYNVQTGGWPFVTAISAGDVDGDGHADLAVGQEDHQDTVLLRNKGDGTFAPKELVAVSWSPWLVRWGDFNGDGRADLAVVAWNYALGSRLGILLNGGGDLLGYESNREPKQYPYDPWFSPGEIACADLDNDGATDVAVAIAQYDKPGYVIVILNEGGGLGEGTAYPLGLPGQSSARRIAAADLNGDGLVDLVACTGGGGLSANKAPGLVHVLVNRGAGEMELLPPLELPGFVPIGVDIGDVDGDGTPEVAVLATEHHTGNNYTLTDRKVVILDNDGAGKLSIRSEVKVATMTSHTGGGLTLGDLDGDGSPDLAAICHPTWMSVQNGETGRLFILRNDGAGEFSIDAGFETGGFPRSLFIGDLDGDGHADIAVGHSVNYKDDPYLMLFMNDGSGRFSPGQSLSDPNVRAHRMAAADLDGDGHTDLLWSVTPAQVMVHLNNGDGTFAPYVQYGVGFGPGAMAAADLDGDGRPEVITGNSSDYNLSVLRNLSCPECYADCDGSGSLDIDDFLCFQLKFAQGDPYADCDGNSVLNIDDLVCFQVAFALGC